MDFMSYEVTMARPGASDGNHFGERLGPITTPAACTPRRAPGQFRRMAVSIAPAEFWGLQ